MSAQYLVYFRGQPVRFRHQLARRMWEIVPRNMASIFISEADAWIAAKQHELKPEESVEVKPLNAQPGVVC